MRKTQVAVQNRGPGNTHREGTYLQLGSPAMRMHVAVCLHMQTMVGIYVLVLLVLPVLQMLLIQVSRSR